MENARVLSACRFRGSCPPPCPAVPLPSRPRSRELFCSALPEGARLVTSQRGARSQQHLRGAGSVLARSAPKGRVLAPRSAQEPVPPAACPPLRSFSCCLPVVLLSHQTNPLGAFPLTRRGGLPSDPRGGRRHGSDPAVRAASWGRVRFPARGFPRCWRLCALLRLPAAGVARFFVKQHGEKEK